ncbi:MAG: hypothetical protein ACLFTY_01715 [Candidatus Aenigmatarchaeota archaeon]
MKFLGKELSVELEEEVFKDAGSELRSNGWFWLFWLFFIDDPSEVEKPR